MYLLARSNAPRIVQIGSISSEIQRFYENVPQNGNFDAAPSVLQTAVIQFQSLIIIKLRDQFGQEISAYHRNCDCHARNGEHRSKLMWIGSSNPILAPEILINYPMIRWMIEVTVVLKRDITSN